MLRLSGKETNPDNLASSASEVKNTPKKR